MINKIRLAVVLCLVLSSQAHAWGRRGHALVGEIAAELVSHEPNAAPLHAHAYDIGYYCNAPDFFWRSPATSAYEAPQHYMNFEFFTPEFAGHPEIKNPFALTRGEFQQTFPQIKPEAGGAYWRIREFYDQLQKYAEQLKSLKEPTGPTRQTLQAKWIVLAGLMGHYVGDLAQPLHVTLNYDGKSSGQAGIHGFFEDVCVDEAYPRLAFEAADLARRRWPDFKTRHANMGVLEMIEELTQESVKLVPELLSIDKHHAREKKAAACQAFHRMITQRIAQGSLVLAELYRRTTGWPFDNNHFYFFRGQPDYIMPGPIND